MFKYHSYSIIYISFSNILNNEITLTLSAVFIDEKIEWMGSNFIHAIIIHSTMSNFLKGHKQKTRFSHPTLHAYIQRKIRWEGKEFVWKTLLNMYIYMAVFTFPLVQTYKVVQVSILFNCSMMLRSKWKLDHWRSHF